MSKKIIKTVLSYIIIFIFIAIAVNTFSKSLNDDKYINFIKNNYVKDITNRNNEFVGFKGKVVSSTNEIKSKYGNISVLFYKLEYQNYICSSHGTDKKCNWQTYKTEFESTPFILNVNGNEIEINKFDNSNFITIKTEIYEKTTNHRILQSTIEKDDNIYVWGLLKNNNLEKYNNEEYNNKNILIITNDAMKMIEIFISDVLWAQILTVVFIVFMMLLIYMINRNEKEKTYIAKSTKNQK